MRHIDADTGEKGDLGAVYVTSVSGPKQYAADPKDMERYDKDGYQPDKRTNLVQFFQVITIEDNTLNFVAYDVLGQERDHFTITKDFKTNKRIFCYIIVLYTKVSYLLKTLNMFHHSIMRTFSI